MKDSIEQLVTSTKRKNHEIVLQMLIDAGNQLGVFESVFSPYRKPSQEFKDYIIAEAIKREYYRHRVVVEGFNEWYGFDVPIANGKDFLQTIYDMRNGDYQKYLSSKDTKIVFMLSYFLGRFYPLAFDKYLNANISSQDKHIRLISLYFISRYNTNKLELCEKHFEQEDLEMYSMLLDCIPSIEGNPFSGRSTPNKNNFKATNQEKDLYEKLYNKLVNLYDRLEKEEINYSASNEIWCVHRLSKSEILSKVIYIFKTLRKKSMILHFEKEYYPKLSIRNRIDYIVFLREETTLNYRKEMLQYFSGQTNLWYTPEYFTQERLSFEEGVIISDYLKSKKDIVKKTIVDHYLKMDKADYIELVQYLQNASEIYKKECGQELEKVLNLKSTPSKKDCKLPKVEVADLPVDKIIQILDSFKTFVQEHKSFVFKTFYGEMVVFGTLSHSYQIDKNENTPFKEEMYSILDRSGISYDELVSLYCSGLSYGYADIKSNSFGGKKLDTYLDKNLTIFSVYFCGTINNYIEDKNDCALYEAILNRVIYLLAKVTDFPDPQADYHSDDSKKEEPNKKLLRVLYELASKINYKRISDDSLKKCPMLIAFLLEKKCSSIFYKENMLPYYLYEKKIIDEATTLSYLKSNLFVFDALLTPKRREENERQDSCIVKITPEYKKVLEKALMGMLDCEIERGEAAAAYTEKLRHHFNFCGIKYYIKALKTFQKATLPRNTYDTTRSAMFGRILEHIVPYSKDTYEQFASMIQSCGLKEKDLIKGVLYNSDSTVLEWTDKYLQKKGFISTVLFFKSHLRDTDVSSAVKDKIALYSPINIEDFKEGAVDTDWFWSMKKEIDSKTFDLIYDNAKYITVANFHKRAQRFSDALMGKLTREECLDKISTTRNKEFLLCYSLIPLMDETEINTRYEIIQKFLLEAKQFGAQRQASEKKACEIALENIARIAGYEDVDRFIWYMESKDSAKILPHFLPVQVNDVSIYIVINERFKCSVVADKNGQRMSALPASVKSHLYALELKAVAMGLNKQSSRVIKSMECAMERASAFKIDELQQIATHPVIREILKKLFFVTAGKSVLFDGEIFIDFCSGEKVKPSEVTIAHPLDFLQMKCWEAAQKHMLSSHIRQPFKQVFRELYVKMDDEIGAKEINRYSGHQINVQKAIAVAKGRGWHSGGDVGLQKVFYKENIVAVILGEWDFGYSSFDDHPTISNVYFFDRHTYKTLPINDINDKMFSEVMRDIDLIVATSHPQGYDFEESMSTVDVRKQICGVITDIMGLKNISVSDYHVHIQGEYGGYSINLKSGNAYKQLFGALNIMAINDSTQNKAFMDFIDDNPKTSEVVSKMLLLADDKMIKDPNILCQIKIKE